MRADSGLGRIIGALGRDRATSPPSALPRYGIQVSTISGRIVEALARTRPLQHELLVTDSPMFTGPHNSGQQHHQFTIPGADIIDFTVPDTRKARREGPTSQRDRTRLTPFILASLGTAALIVAAHLSPLFTARPGIGWNSTTPAREPAPFAFTGYGFDTCSAPSLTVMRHWQSSPYRAIFVYVGGGDSACAPGDLSASWVRAVEELGWTVFPVYVGLQAPSFQGSDIPTINPKLASKEGAAAALDALKDARHFGIPANVPLIDDMEGSSFKGAAGAASLVAVRNYLSAWDLTLRRADAYSGAYTSCDNDSAIFPNSGKVTRPDVLIGALWDGQASVSSGCGLLSQRPWGSAHAKQYLGNVTKTFGGISMRIGIYTIKIELGDLASAPAEKRSGTG